MLSTIPDALIKDLIQPTPQCTRDEKKLNEIKNSLREATVKWMKKIAENNQQAMDNYAKDPKYTRRNIWYTEDLLKACQVCKQSKMEQWIRENNYQLLGFLSPKFFDKIEEDNQVIKKLVNTKFKAGFFISKENVLASDAFNEIFNGIEYPVIIDCGIACKIAEYGALFDVLGKEKFNRLFSGAVDNRMNLNYTSNDKPMSYFIKPTKFASRFVFELAFKTLKFESDNNKKPDSNEIAQLSSMIKIGEIGNRPIKRGQIVPIKGCKDYNKKFPFGVWKNVNVICSDDTQGQQKFVGLGLNPEGETESEICEKLLKNRNKIEDPLFLAPNHYFSLFPNRKRWNQMRELELKDAQEAFSRNFPPVKEVEGYLPSYSGKFKTELIYDLIELPLEAVSMDFVKKHTDGNSLLENLHAAVSDH